MRRGLNLRGLPLTPSLCLLAASLVASACFKTLDESLLDGTSGGSGGSAGSAGAGATGGSGASGGSAGVGGAGAQDAGGDSASDATADQDAEVPISVSPWEMAAFPATDVAGGAQGALISVDANYVYWIAEDAVAQVPSKTAFTGGTVAAGGASVDRASAILGPAVSGFLYIGVGAQATDDGRLVRFDKVPVGPNPAVDIPHLSNFGRITGMTVTTESTPRLLAVAKTSGAGEPHILSVGLAGGGTTLELVYTDPDGNQTGGPILTRGACIYWLSNGRAYSVPLAGGSRVSALATPVTDATGIASDGTRLFVSRSNGEIWQRSLFGATCDGGGPPETRVLEGFPGAKELVSYADRIAFIASDSELGEGGVFSHQLSSRSVQQVAPESGAPELLRQVGAQLVYRSASGVIRRLPDGT